MMRTKDGDYVMGATPAEQVADLRAKAFNQGDNDAEYMRLTASRALLQTGKRVRCDTAEHFIADLMEAGLLWEE